MFYLYLKTHNKTGLKYLGYTKQDPHIYKGSGKYWSSHIKKYGYDVITEILFQSEDIDEISAKGSYYSKLWAIVENSEFANLCEEDGNRLFGRANINFRGHPQSKETRLKISENNGLGNKGKTGKDHPAFGHKMHPDFLQNLAKARSALAVKGAWNKGKVGLQKASKETRLKMSLAHKGKQQKTVQCPNCGKTGGKPAMMRFHFEKCKEIKV